MSETGQKLPRARTKKLSSRKLRDELIIYDHERDRATCLNSFAADVWGRCDGVTPTAAIAEALSKISSNRVDERAVWLAVDQLSRSKLLEEAIEIPPSVLGGSSRRALLRVLTLAAAAVPVVLSVESPSPVAAASCRRLGQSCSPTMPCCAPWICAPFGGGRCVV
jgi:hypothetical protein